MKEEVIQGDCLEVMKGMAENSVDMVLTSPPYDNLRDYKGYTFDFEGIAKELYRITKDGGVVVWVVGDATIKGSETGTSFKQALYFKEIGFNLHDTMIYEKSTTLPQNCDRYYQIFEYMFILSKGKPKTFNPLKVLASNGGKRKDKTAHRTKDNIIVIPKTGRNEYRRLFNVWRYAVGLGGTTNDKIAFQHPAIFPEKLAEDHILSWSNEGDTILDPMAGSGTTLKMAKKNNRNYIGIEISQEYIDIINKRLAHTLTSNKVDF
jgi:DNA modification methylase